MTLPHEQVFALKRSHKFLQSILTMRLCDFRKMKKDEFQAWKNEAYYASKHYPYDHEIDNRWSDDVCKKCSDTKTWCKCKEEECTAH